MPKNDYVIVTLPGAAAGRVLAAGLKIPDDFLGVDGREDEPHITIKYGVRDDIEAIRDTVHHIPPFTVRLGKCHVFIPSESSGYQAPIVVEAISPQLEELHDMIAKSVGAKPDDFPYKPHVTVAYVKPEHAKQFENSNMCSGISFPVNSVVLSRKNGSREVVLFQQVPSRVVTADFLLGDCVSFACALQQEMGGEIYTLVRDGKPHHAFVKKDGKNYDAKGQRGTYSMARDMFGSADGVSVAGPYAPEQIPPGMRKATPKMIEKAQAYIQQHKSGSHKQTPHRDEQFVEETNGWVTQPNKQKGKDGDVPLEILAPSMFEGSVTATGGDDYYNVPRGGATDYPEFKDFEGEEVERVPESLLKSSKEDDDFEDESDEDRAERMSGNQDPRGIGGGWKRSPTLWPKGTAVLSPEGKKGIVIHWMPVGSKVQMEDGTKITVDGKMVAYQGWKVAKTAHPAWSIPLTANKVVVASVPKFAFKIEVPKSVRDHFWEEPPEGHNEFWAFRHEPAVLPNETLIFTFNGVPVAEVVTAYIEKPGETECAQTKRYKKHWKVYWDPSKFKKYAAAGPLMQYLNGIRSHISGAAQRVYDEWTQGPDGMDEEMGGGGICDLMSDVIASQIMKHGAPEGTEITEGGQQGDDHAWLVAYNKRTNEVYGVDIPPNVYETGGGYSWKKILDVAIKPENVEIWKLEVGIEDIEMHEGSTKTASGFEVSNNLKSGGGLSIASDAGEIVLETVQLEKRSLYVYGIEVADEYRGKGEGQKLYDEAIRWMKRHGYTKLYSSTDANRSPEANKAWQRLSQRYPIEDIGGAFAVDLRKVHEQA